jgi:hypothetical protein
MRRKTRDMNQQRATVMMIQPPWLFIVNYLKRRGLTWRNHNGRHGVRGSLSKRFGTLEACLGRAHRMYMQEDPSLRWCSLCRYQGPMQPVYVIVQYSTCVHHVYVKHWPHPARDWGLSHKLKSLKSTSSDGIRWHLLDRKGDPSGGRVVSVVRSTPKLHTHQKE